MTNDDSIGDGESGDRELCALCECLGKKLLAAGLRMVTAESCTGGWVAKACTDVSGSSQWFECGFVTYSNAAKMREIGVSEQTLADHGAVSEQTVREMAEGALCRASEMLISVPYRTETHVAVSTSGIAGPDGGSLEKPVGTVWFGLAVRRGVEVAVTAERHVFAGDRETIRRRSVRRALELVLAVAWS
jgi:nicotinamide-nucleotide amidase